MPEHPPHAEEVAKSARLASHLLQTATPEQISQALTAIKSLLAERKDEILAENKKDLEKAKLDVQNGKLSQSLYKRLDLAGEKFNSLLEGVSDVDKLPSPVGQVTLATKLDDGLDLYRVTCPVGVLLIIFEARPEVVVQISCLALKSGNAVILKGGKEASHSNSILMRTLQDALDSVQGIPKTAVQLVETRDDISALLKLDPWIDLVIPRGSKQLVTHVQENTRIPVLGHADGLCATFIDESADLSKAISVVVDAKTSYPAACNTTETLLVHRSAASRILPGLSQALIQKGVELRADEESRQYLPAASDKIKPSVQEDYDTEFLDLILAVKTVSDLEEAISHINQHGSHHTDAIVTESEENARAFMQKVDAAGVFWNASTRFADGFRFGFGAEIGVSTNKTHARGPVGLEGLVIYKYKLFGSGHATADYGSGKRRYIHEPIDKDTVAAKRAKHSSA
ncbi:glutamate-5-semialdehyde dehydrogenase [Polychytrium aggregatum]|uniref:glutamate-5-semialdehyde dehydrogenase n=1 Tax=Polychytrium aggregatum TaxID=110093 RepID=UPI0022FEFB5D|nr:glutamate-5-semialdehyde dehydrogenase [Polychytrium aggregatum]KAI9202875.1 glutamate-5-semialdehyde dehydrogenase [Polychytrium aggregatum]